MKENKFRPLREIILNNEVATRSKNSSLFGGAGISIVSKIPILNDDFYENPVFVVTNYSKELSWLFFQLKDLFADKINHYNKNLFYSRLANKAVGYRKALISTMYALSGIGRRNI